MVIYKIIEVILFIKFNIDFGEYSNWQESGWLPIGHYLFFLFIIGVLYKANEELLLGQSRGKL